jgi:hypothetical protein
VDNAYSWLTPSGNDPTILNISPEKLLKNADVRSLIGHMALLADRGFTLKREPANQGDTAAMVAYEDNRRKGRLFLYTYLTKRAIQRRMARLARRYKKA